MVEAKRRSAASVWTSTFRAGRYTLLTYQPGAGLRAEWSPAIPKAATFSPADMAASRRGRDAILAEVVKALGQGVILIEA
jgi:hypothetical protein